MTGEVPAGQARGRGLGSPTPHDEVVSCPVVRAVAPKGPCLPSGSRGCLESSCPVSCSPGSRPEVLDQMAVRGLGGWASSSTAGILRDNLMFAVTKPSRGRPSLHMSSQGPVGHLRCGVSGLLAGCPSTCHSGRRMRGLPAPCLLLGGHGVLEPTGQEGAAPWLRSRPACWPPHWSPVAAAPGAGGAGLAERAGGQGRHEKALHGPHKGRL